MFRSIKPTCWGRENFFIRLSASGTNKTLALPSVASGEQTRLWRYRAWRAGKKQDFGVAERGERGRNKTLALPSVAGGGENRLWRFRAWPAGRKTNVGGAGPGGRGA